MKFLLDIFYLFFPNTCVCCDSNLSANEKTICLKCRFELPVTHFTALKNNPVEEIFFGRIPVAYATSLLFYKDKGISQHLISQLKYKGNQNIGTFLGEWIGDALKHCERFPDIDYIIPVPLHPKKLKKRGYNQLTTFGESLSKILDTPYIDTLLIRKSITDSQTHKSRIDRFKNVKEIFYLTDTSFLKNKHILLIDDVITTGATIEACALELGRTKNITISIVTMSFTA